MLERLPSCIVGPRRLVVTEPRRESVLVARVLWGARGARSAPPECRNRTLMVKRLINALLRPHLFLSSPGPVPNLLMTARITSALFFGLFSKSSRKKVLEKTHCWRCVYSRPSLDSAREPPVKTKTIRHAGAAPRGYGSQAESGTAGLISRPLPRMESSVPPYWVNLPVRSARLCLSRRQ